MIGKIPLAAAVFTVLASSHSFAAEKEYLPIDQAVATLVDGRPWTVNAPDGKKLSFTLKTDGTGSIRGPLPVPLSVTWTIIGDELCVATPRGAKCLRFQQVSGGLQGWDDDKKDLKFSRQP